MGSRSVNKKDYTFFVRLPFYIAMFIEREKYAVYKKRVSINKRIKYWTSFCLKPMLGRQGEGRVECTPLAPLEFFVLLWKMYIHSHIPANIFPTVICSPFFQWKRQREEAHYLYTGKNLILNYGCSKTQPRSPNESIAAPPRGTALDFFLCWESNFWHIRTKQFRQLSSLSEFLETWRTAGLFIVLLASFRIKNFHPILKWSKLRSPRPCVFQFYK